MRNPVARALLLFTASILAMLYALGHASHAGAQSETAPTTCQVGIYLRSLHSFDPNADTFGGDLWLWSVCPSENDQPLHTMEFVNADDAAVLLDVPGNPFWAYRYWEVGRDNKTQYLHGPDEAFPWRGEALAAHLARLVNLLFGALTVWLTWRTARAIWPGRPALATGSAAFVAFNPMFLYIQSSVHDDALVNLLGGLVNGMPRSALELLDQVSVLTATALSSLFWQALIALLYLAWLVVWWRGRTPQQQYQRELRS